MKTENVLPIGNKESMTDNGAPSAIMSASCIQEANNSSMSRDKSSSSGIHKKTSKMIQPCSATSLELLSKIALQYSVYLQTDLSAQISRLEEYLQESVAKLEEQQSLFEIKEIESKEWTLVILPQLVKQAELMSSTMTKRLDSLNELIVSIRITLDKLDKQITLAEQKFGLYPSPSSFRSVFKYFMKTESPPSSAESPDVIGWEMVKTQLICDDPLNLSSFFK